MMMASDCRLEALAADVRADDADGRLDVAATAHRLGASVRQGDLGPHVEAVMFDGVIVLNRSLPSPGRRRFAFAHEVAHLLISRARMLWVDRHSEEWWADWFAHELIFPKRWLREKRWEQLRLFNDPAERQTIALHLLGSMHRESAMLRVDDTVICGRCGDRQLFNTCDCQHFRADANAMAKLPTLVDTNRLEIDRRHIDNDAVATLWRYLVVQTAPDSGRGTPSDFWPTSGARGPEPTGVPR